MTTAKHCSDHSIHCSASIFLLTHTFTAITAASDTQTNLSQPHRHTTSMPFLCCFARNPCKRNKRMTSQPPPPSPRMVQVPRDSQRSATTNTRGMPVPKARVPAKFVPTSYRPENINYKMENAGPLKCKALNPNQLYPLPSEAPPPPQNTPTINKVTTPTCLTTRHQQMYEMDKAKWLTKTDRISSCGLGSAEYPTAGYPLGFKSGRLLPPTSSPHQTITQRRNQAGSSTPGARQAGSKTQRPGR